MTKTPSSWEKLEDLVAGGDEALVRAFLEELDPADRTLALSRLTEDARASMVEFLAADDAAGFLGPLPETQVAGALDDVAPETAVAVLREFPAGEQADLLGELREDRAERILSAMEPGEASEVRALREYENDVAGGVMVTEHLALPAASTVGEVVASLRDRADEVEDLDVQYVYLTDGGGRLVGVLRLRDLLLARAARPATDLMIPDPLRVLDTARVDELADFFVEHAFVGVPVVDEGDRLLGVVHRGAVEGALRERADRDLLRSQGLLEDELRSMPLSRRAGGRLTWLSLNVLLNVVAASVIAVFEDTLQQVIALAVFLPIISDMSGCSGNQAVAVSMRELSLGLVRPTEALRVWRQEVTVGLVNGLVLGLLVALGGWLWQGNPWFGAVVGAALAINTVVAVSLGGCVPLVLKRMGLDPAIGSGPILTTVTDMCGFFLVLGLATLALPYIM